MEKTIKAVAATALTVVSLVAMSGAKAALVSRLGGKAYYDDVAKLTWLQDANNAATSGYVTSVLTYGDNGDGYYGTMTWQQATAWASSLSVSGVTGWRLPGRADGLRLESI